ncbi:hypothetical protein TSAR_007928 [Trichomalopsis sarcophagae]|uniref:Uncharacterized protein n=1 Tax=Trichomalopsis sarcophagae TaxID=543379 RepID=A0A232FBS6_9HYME|nr:hypothetical protein TSAR_007928 [Trichomalopsis sarcophagae]
MKKRKQTEDKERPGRQIYKDALVEMHINGKILAKVTFSAGSIANHNKPLGYFLPGRKDLNRLTTSQEPYYL